MESDMPFDPNRYKINDSLTLREYQLKNLEILRYFDLFCREHGLVYYICGGTCIGALRHKGFIPRDCDIDVFMKRDDYERLSILWNRYADTEHYSYDRTTKDYNMHDQQAGIKDNLTTYIRSHNVDCDINHGIQIDITPLDGISQNFIMHQLQKIAGMIYCLFNAQRLPNQENGFVRALSGLLLAMIQSHELRYKIWSSMEAFFTKYEIEKCNYVGEFTTGIRNINLKFSKEWFQKPKELDFEGMKVMAPTEPEKYLDVRYPGYMEYPPEEEQVPKFTPAFIDITTPYKHYKGKQYCVNSARRS